MPCNRTLKTGVSPDMKLQAKAAADREFLSEAAWLKRLVAREIRTCSGAPGVECVPQRSEVDRPTGAAPRAPGAGKPMFVRLAVEDRLLAASGLEAGGGLLGEDRDTTLALAYDQRGAVMTRSRPKPLRAPTRSDN